MLPPVQCFHPCLYTHTAPACLPACLPACSEETALLQRLHELNPALIRRLCHRLFFVVNKCDAVSITSLCWRSRMGGGAAASGWQCQPQCACSCAASLLSASCQ